MLKIILKESGVFILKKIGISIKSNLRALVIICIVGSLFISYNVFFRNNEVDALSKYGSRGEEVRTIQTKLKRWGYYKGNVDGIYGSQTLAAVKLFQKKNGLTVDRNSREENSRSNGNI